jgi:hypothetical protein
MLNWLLSLNISRHYADTYYGGFSAQFLDQRSLKLVSDSNLRDLGVQALGHRVLILDSASSGETEMERGERVGKEGEDWYSTNPDTRGTERVHSLCLVRWSCWGKKRCPY